MQKMPAFLKFFLWLALIAWMAILTKNILLKGDKDHSITSLKSEFNKRNIKKRWAKANTEPFATIELFYYSRKLGVEYKAGNLGGNVLGFVPLGILLPMLISWLRRGWQTFFAVFLTSLGFETAQLFFNLGVFDVDDLILNSAGGVIGYIIYWICRTIIRRKNHDLKDHGSLV